MGVYARFMKLHLAWLQALDGTSFLCSKCGDGGGLEDDDMLLVCDSKGCGRAHHMRCSSLEPKRLDFWRCDMCVIAERVARRRRQAASDMVVISTAGNGGQLWQSVRGQQGSGLSYRAVWRSLGWRGNWGRWVSMGNECQWAMRTYESQRRCEFGGGAGGKQRAVAGQQFNFVHKWTRSDDCMVGCLYGPASRRERAEWT